MRKFFKSLLAVALVGAMVGNVACNKYDDDINSLNERLDKIEGTMALKTDLQAVQSTVNALNAINFDAFMKSADFASMLEKAGVSKNQILALIEGLQDADDVAATFDAMMKAYDIWGKIEAAMVEAFGGAEGDDVKATIDAWLGAEFAEYMKSYDAKVAKDIEDANKALYDSIMEAISKGETTSAGLAVRIDAIEKAIKDFEALVYEVAGRIQSLVWVPNSLIQASTNMVKLTNTNIVLTKGNTGTVVPMWNPEVTMTWQVSPAAVASKIQKENLSIVTEEISRAAASYVAPEFEVLKAEAKDGKITVTFKATTDLNKMNPEKAPMVALNVKMGSEEAGINFTSNYVALLVENKTVSTRDFKYVYGEKAVAFGGETANEIEYTNTDKHLFLEGGFIGMQVDGKYVDVTTQFESLGENGWLDIVCTPEVDADENLVASKLYEAGVEVTDEALLSKISLSHEGFGLGEVNNAFIGKTVKSGAYTYTIEGEAGSYTLGTIVDVYDITTITKTVAVEAQKFIWTYANAMEDNNYSKTGLSLTGLTAAQYQALGDGLEGGLYNAAGTTRLNDAYIEFTTEPTANTDVMWFDLEITDAEAFEVAGNYVAKFTKTIADCDVVITIPVVVEKGIVKLATANLGDKVYTYNGQYVYDLVADVKKAILEANAGVFNEQFTQANFEHMWANGTFAEVGNFSIARNAEVKLSINMENANFGTAYNVGYELTADVTESLVTGVSAKVMLVKPQVKFVANPYYVVDGRMEMITAFNGTEFDVIDKKITKAYAIEGVEGAKLSYEIATDLTNFTGTKPAITFDSISGDYTLSWGAWNKLELELVAKATLEGVEIGSQKFVAYINDPVAKAITTVKNADLTLYAGESKNVYDVLSLIANEKNVFDATNDCLEANLESALNASVIFETEELNPALSFDKTTGWFAVDAAGMNIQGDHPVTIKVVYTYTFGVREFAFDFVVKSGTRPQGI